VCLCTRCLSALGQALESKLSPDEAQSPSE